jgi:adenosylcobinamide-phosphate synthase
MAGAEAALVLGAAFVLDSTLREPPNTLHPVVWMGHAIAPLKRFRAPPMAELAVGALYASLVAGGFAFATWILLQLTSGSPLIAGAIQVYLLWSCFALSSLCAAGEEMARALERDDLARARRALTSLCSRDPGVLSPSELAGATIESLSENASDSVVAPLLYFALLGVPGALFYRVANTLDAMVGYRGRFEYLGKFAARLDDLLNLVPARLTALLLYVVGWPLRLSLRQGLAVCWRDRGRTESPNAGWPMAMAAGLLRVRLDKRDVYTLGAELRAPDVEAVRAAIQLVRAAGVLMVALTLLTLALASRWLDG